MSDTDTHFLDQLSTRGLLHECSDTEQLRKLHATHFYCGFDPTAPSLQLGNLVPIMAMSYIARSGHKPVVLFGGATGAIGDPSGKSSERKLLSEQQIEHNLDLQKKQFIEIFKRLEQPVQFVNNAEWSKDLSLLDFLREVGKYFTVNWMMQKDSVKTRLEGDGISYTEFSYMLLQAHDFYHLYTKHGVKLQVGASDQWGNITAGLELIRRKAQGHAFGLVFPLLTDSNGKKFGKSESGSIWLDQELTSPYELHQFLLNSRDDQVIKLIKIFSRSTQEEIRQLEADMLSAPEKRLAQKALADEVCNLVHGPEATQLAKRCADVLFGGSFEGLSKTQLVSIFKDAPASELTRARINELSFVELLLESTLVKSKGEAKRLLQSGGAYLNNQRISDEQLKLKDSQALASDLLVLRTGKKNYHLIKVV